MARMLYLRDSATFMLNVLRRHQRLSRKVQAGENYSKDIQPVFDKLKAQVALNTQAEVDRQNSHDDVLFADSDLDNVIRDVYDACKGYDRNNAGSSILNTIFENGTFSEIIHMPYDKEPGEAEKLIVKLESFGASHNIFPQAARLRKAIEDVNKALEVFKTQIRNEKKVEAEMEIIKMETIRAYENNYLNARRQFGSALTEKIFPVLSLAAVRPQQVESN